MHDPNDHHRPLRVGSLFSGYGGLDLAVEHVLNAETTWYSENNQPIARVFAHHWPDAPNLGDITTIDWNDVPPVDVLCGGFPCQDVSTIGKRAGLAPGTRSGLWSHMAEAIEALQPRYVVIENVRGLLSSPAIRTPLKGDDDGQLNLEPATPDAATLRNLEPNPWHLGDDATRPLRAAGAVMWSAWLCRPARGLALSLDVPAYSSSPTAKTLFRTPLATDASRGGESLDQVRARRGTIALSHQVIDLALNGQHGSASRYDDPETLWSLIEDIFSAGDATPMPSPDGSTSRGYQSRHQSS